MHDTFLALFLYIISNRICSLRHQVTDIFAIKLEVFDISLSFYDQRAEHFLNQEYRGIEAQPITLCNNSNKPKTTAEDIQRG